MKIKIELSNGTILTVEIHDQLANCIIGNKDKLQEVITHAIKEAEKLTK